MTITAVIAEYNPFITAISISWQSQELTGADYLVVIMSGDFVQRGAPAILDQHDRASWRLARTLSYSFRVTLHSAVHSISHAGGIASYCA